MQDERDFPGRGERCDCMQLAGFRIEMDFEIENDVRGRGQRATNVELIDSAYNAPR